MTPAVAEVAASDDASAEGVDGKVPNKIQNFLDDALDLSKGNVIATGGGAGGRAIDRSGFEILSHIKDINNWLQLLTGGDAILFTSSIANRLLLTIFRFKSLVSNLSLFALENRGRQVFAVT